MLHVAADDFVTLQPSGHRVGLRTTRASVRAAKGIRHAYEDDQDETLCGLFVDDLYRFHPQDFASVQSPHRCTQCDELAGFPSLD